MAGGMMAVGNSLENAGIKGLLGGADRQTEAQLASDKLKTQAVGNAINTAGSALGVGAIAAVQAKKSGILSDIF